MFEVTAPIIGVTNDDSAFDQRVFALSPGSTVAAVTDGFTEAYRERWNFLGVEPVVNLVTEQYGNNALLQAQALTQRAFDHTGGNLHDDVAALVVRLT